MLIQVDLWGAAAFVLANTGTIMTLALYLHKRRGDRLKELADRIESAEERASNDHRALAVSISDTNRTIAEHYIRRSDLMPMLKDIKADVISGNEAIDALRTRVDQLYQSVEWRKGPR